MIGLLRSFGSDVVSFLRDSAIRLGHILEGFRQLWVSGFNGFWFATFGLDEHLEAELALARGQYERSARRLEKLVTETEGTLERVGHLSTRRMMRRLGLEGGLHAIEAKKHPEASPAH